MNKFSNISEYTVSQLNKSIKNIIEGNFRIIKVLGELTQVKNIHLDIFILLKMKRVVFPVFAGDQMFKI